VKNIARVGQRKKLVEQLKVSKEPTYKNAKKN